MKAEYLKEIVGLSSLVEKLGYFPSRTGFIHCPAHTDKTASLKIYQDNDKGWYCYSCGHGGTIIDFYMLEFNCDFRTAVQGIASLYGLSGEELSTQNKLKIMQARRKKSQYKKSEQEKKDLWTRYITAKQLIENNTKTDIDDFPDNVIQAYYNIEWYWYEYFEYEKGGDT